MEKAAPSVLQVNLSPSLTVCSYITNDNQLTLTLLKEGKIESRGQNILQKQQILCNTKENETRKKILSFLECFQMYHVVTTENEKTETNPFTYAHVASTSSSTSDKDNLPDEIKMLVSEGNVESIVYYGSGYGMQAKCKVTYKKDDKDSRYTTYEFFWIERETNKKKFKLKKLCVNSFLQITYFQMSVGEDQIDSANIKGLNALVFDEENQKRCSWKFFNSRLPRSEVVYFSQILIILFLIVVSLTKLVFSQLDCEESIFWFSLLSCTAGYALPNPKLSTK